MCGFLVLAFSLYFGPLAYSATAQTAPPPGAKRVSSVPTSCPISALTPPGGWVGAGPIYAVYWFTFTLVAPAIG